MEISTSDQSARATFSQDICFLRDEKVRYPLESTTCKTTVHVLKVTTSREIKRALWQCVFQLPKKKGYNVAGYRQIHRKMFVVTEFVGWIEDRVGSLSV